MRETAKRESSVLAAAAEQIDAQGFFGLTMDSIAKATELSKGTLYQHFSCKEEILVVLVSHGLERRLELFERAAGLPGRSRERVVSVFYAQELFCRLAPHHGSAEIAFEATSALEKATEEQAQRHASLVERTQDLLRQLVRDASSGGDLSLDSSEKEDRVVRMLTMLTTGAQFQHARARGSEETADTALLDFRTATSALLDGLSWKPSSNELNYEETHLRARTQLFRAELDELG